MPPHPPHQRWPGVPAPDDAARGGSNSRARSTVLDGNRIVIGLLGGIGAGKSYVGRRIVDLFPGAVVDADALAHEALDVCARDGRLAETLGDEFVTREGLADRKRLGERVFKDAAMLRRLERMVHPMVSARIQDVIEGHRSGQGPAVLVLDVPLLLEVGLDRSCDVLWFVEVSDAVRRDRTRERGLSWEDTQLREQSQSPLERKRMRADWVIRNDVGGTELDEQIREALDVLGVRAPTRT